MITFAVEILSQHFASLWLHRNKVCHWFCWGALYSNGILCHWLSCNQPVCSPLSDRTGNKCLYCSCSIDQNECLSLCIMEAFIPGFLILLAFAREHGSTTLRIQESLWCCGHSTSGTSETSWILSLAWCISKWIHLTHCCLKSVIGFLCSPGPGLSRQTPKTINNRYPDRHATEILRLTLCSQHSKYCSAEWGFMK